MSEARKKLVAIDGNSLLYRAFFAMKYLSTADGTPTNAVYGLTLMLLRVLEEKPDYIAFAFDTPAPTFRHVEYDQYKAHRKAIHDDLKAQLPIARELVNAFGIPFLECPGFEADDIIGAMALEAERENVETVIVTGDLDTLQLVNDHINVMTTIKGVTDTVMYDRDAVVERFGIEPAQMIDYKGLKGDPSDNIPGVPGIGEKTAVDLIQRFGSLENLLEHVDELPEGKVKRVLKENTEIAVLSKRLATIITEVPCDISLENFKARVPDYDTLRDLFVRLEFKTMLKRLPEVGKAEGKAAPGERVVLGSCRRIMSAQELSELIDSLHKAGEFAIRCHTVHGKSIEAELIGLSFSTGPNNTAYVAVLDPVKQGQALLCFDAEGLYEADLSELRGVLESEKLKKYCHDYKLVYASLALRGVELKGVVFDTMLAAYLIDAIRVSYEIGDVAFEQLSLELPGEIESAGQREGKSAGQRVGESGSQGEGESGSREGAVCCDLGEEQSRLCAETEAIYRLKPVLEERLKKDGLYSLLTEVEMPLAPILAEMELTGISIDCDQLGAISTTLEVEIREVERSIYNQAGEEFNIGSPKQLQVILFEKLGLATSKKTKTGYSTSASALEELALDYPIVSDILRYRELTKIRSTYSDALPKLINPRTNRIHTSLNQTVTATGRLSSSDPNLQNIPIRTELGRQIRRAFIASGDNLLLSADYSQIELRIMAHVTQDENMIRAFDEDQDIHSATASAIFNCPLSEVTPEMRRRAKTVNFAVTYGMADFTLSKQLQIAVKEAREYIDTYFARFPGVKKHTEETIESARELGYVQTMLGRRRYIPEIASANRNIRQFAERAAVNMPIQGSAADIMKLAMIRIAPMLKSTSGKLLLQVHDELVLEVSPQDAQAIAQIVREGMEQAYKLLVPVKVDVKIGKNWSEMEGI